MVRNRAHGTAAGAWRDGCHWLVVFGPCKGASLNNVLGMLGGGANDISVADTQPSRGCCDLFVVGNVLVRLDWNIGQDKGGNRHGADVSLVNDAVK